MENAQKHVKLRNIAKRVTGYRKSEKDSEKTKSTVINITETGRWIGGPSTQLKKRKTKRERDRSFR